MENNEIAKINGLAITAETPAGAAYVRKITHPPTTIPTEYKGIPDQSEQNVVRIEVKSEVNVPLLHTVPAGQPPNVDERYASRIMFLSLPGALVSNYVFYYVEGQGFVQASPYPANQSYPNQVGVASVTNSGYRFDNAKQDFAQLRNVYKSCTYYLNATAFTNQGTVTTAKFKPNVMTSVSANERAAFTKCLSTQGLTLTPCGTKIQEKNDFEIVNGDKSITAQYTFQILNLGSDQGNVIFNSNHHFLEGVLPTSPSDVLVMSSKAATRPAFEGAFVVHQKCGPVDEWFSMFQQTQTATNFGRLPRCYMRILNGQSPAYIPLYTTNTPNTNTPLAQTFDMPWNNLDAAITMFDGLSIPLNSISGQISTAPYITVKTFHGIEIQPTIFSSLLPFQELLPFNDPKAMQIASGIFHSRPDSLPASANDFATIGNAIMKYLPTAVSWLTDLFKKKPVKQVRIVETKPAPKPQKRKLDKTPVRPRRSQSAPPQRNQRPRRNNNSNTAPVTTLPTYQNKPVQYESVHGVPLARYMSEMRLDQNAVRRPRSRRRQQKA